MKFNFEKNIVLWILISHLSCTNFRSDANFESIIDNKNNDNDLSAISSMDKLDTIKHVKIGDQYWMLENLDTDTFRNGDEIFQAKTIDEWKKANKNKTPASCSYDFADSNISKYGKLYNWYAVSDVRGIAPNKWKIPTVNDFKSLEKNIGVLSINAIDLKSNEGWPFKQGSNKTGFNALPAGGIFVVSGFKNKNQVAYFWTSTIEEVKYDNRERACLLMLNYRYSMITCYPFENGISVRCIKE